MKSEEIASPEWKHFKVESPELDRPFHIKYGDNPEPSPSILRIHRDPPHLPWLQRQDGSEWVDVNMANAAWIVRNSEWRYVPVAENADLKKQPGDK